MVIAGRSVHITTLFSWASLNKQLTSNRAHTFACNWQQPFMNDSAEGRRMTVEIISWSISTKVWDRAGIELATPGSAVSFASVTRHVTDCATRPCCKQFGSKPFDTLIVFLKEFFEKVDFEKSLQMTAKAWKITILIIGLDKPNFERKIVNIFIPISLSICFGCSKGPSHWDGSFEYPQHMFWLRNKKIIFLVHTLN